MHAFLFFFPLAPFPPPARVSACFPALLLRKAPACDLLVAELAIWVHHVRRECRAARNIKTPVHPGHHSCTHVLSGRILFHWTASQAFAQFGPSNCQNRQWDLCDSFCNRLAEVVYTRWTLYNLPTKHSGAMLGRSIRTTVLVHMHNKHILEQFARFNTEAPNSLGIVSQRHREAAHFCNLEWMLGAKKVCRCLKSKCTG